MFCTFCIQHFHLYPCSCTVYFSQQTQANGRRERSQSANPCIPRRWFSDRNIIQEIAAGNICQEFTVAKKCLSRNAAQVFCRRKNSALVLACQEAFAVKDNQADSLSVKTCSDRDSQLRSITLLLSARRQNIFKEEFCVTILSH